MFLYFRFPAVFAGGLIIPACSGYIYLKEKIYLFFYTIMVL